MLYIFGGKYDPWAFLDFIFYFIGIYFLIIMFFIFRYKKIKEKILFSYLSCTIPLLLFILFLIVQFEKFAIIMFSIFLIGPIAISYASKFLNNLMKK